MNIILSCYSKKGKGSYVLEKNGVVVDSQVFPILKDSEASLKEYIFESILRGLKSARNVVEHEDLLLIGVQNGHLANWLNGSREYKGYDDYLDAISDIIESIDCRYLFSLTDVKKAKLKIKESPKQEKLEGALSLLDM